MRSKLIVSARVLLGLVFFVFGLNGFLHFMPNPPHAGAAASFLGGLASASYFFPLLKATEVVGGALLLANRYVPLALTVLAPVIVQIAAFHFILEPSPMPVVLLALEIFLAWSYRAAFAPMLRAKVRPTGLAAEDDHVPAAAAQG